MKAEIKDKQGELLSALRSIGISINQENIELILNISELMKKKGLHTTLAEIVECELCVKSLFKN